MNISKKQRSNIILLVVVALLLIPQTRQPIQILIHKGLALFSPSVVDKDERVQISDYNWKLVDENGLDYNFNDAKGKVVVLNFWATWCPPCIAEMPSLEKLYSAYKDEVVFLFVSNEKQVVISAFKQKHAYDFMAYASVTDYPSAFDVHSIPRTFIIDKKGTIVVDKTGAANWNSDAMQTLIRSLLE